MFATLGELLQLPTEGMGIWNSGGRNGSELYPCCLVILQISIKSLTENKKNKSIFLPCHDVQRMSSHRLILVYGPHLNSTDLDKHSLQFRTFVSASESLDDVCSLFLYRFPFLIAFPISVLL